MQPTESSIKIYNILQSIQTSTIVIGDHSGFFISKHQLATLLETYSEEGLEGVGGISIEDEEENLEAELRSQRKEITSKLRVVALQLKQATSEKAVELNLKQGKLLSERAKVDRVLRDFE